MSAPTLPLKNSLKDLFIFAHRGEAQSILQAGQFRPLAISHISQLYCNDSALLLVSGEGVYDALAQTMAVGTALAGQIGRIVNLGVAGGLDSYAQEGKIFEVSCSFLATGMKKTDFHSFSSSTTNKNSLNCISTLERVLQSEHAQFLACHASLVDRELWGIGFAAQQLKLPFLTFKLVVDQAGQNTHCLEIRQQAPLWGKMLLEFWQKHFSVQTPVHKPIHTVEASEQLLQQHFYFTTTQRRQWEKYRNHCQQQGIDPWQKISLPQIIQQTARPKERTQKLIEQMKNILNPFNDLSTIYAQKLQNHCQHFSSNSNAKFSASLDPQEDYTFLKIVAKIADENDYSEFKNLVDTFAYTDLQQLLNGNICSTKS